jgi:hypothetical protein
MKNRKREICTSGSVRDEDGQPPHLLGRRNFLHLATVATVLPAIWRFAWAQNYPARPISISSPPTQLRFGARDLTFFWAPYSCTPLSNACCTGPGGLRTC